LWGEVINHVREEKLAAYGHVGFRRYRTKGKVPPFREWGKEWYERKIDRQKKKILHVAGGGGVRPVIEKKQ